ncbi:MAG: succinate dehydrogenase assembly factor 2 [Methylococcaceae bacterium]|nr:succinate dehydrogenase assembly factor 2 [Methylococcaceae bacterium]
MSDVAKLRWQCRRGTLELDKLLLHYLEKAYQQANGEEQALFKTLLHLEDRDLLAYLLGDQQPAADNLRFLINKIRNAKSGQ